LQSQTENGWLAGFSTRITATRVGAKFFSLVLHKLDAPILKLTRGRHSLTSIFSGIPVMQLTSVGARSGELRTVPLIGLLDDEDVILFATNWGQQKHPGWYHNLRCNPNARIALRGNSRPYLAHEAIGDEFDRYWEQAVALYPGYEKYRSRAAGRQISIFILSPKENGNASTKEP
jgi:deazaflavin-dependent oxidoreductase (nitroreductase family)